MCQHLSLVLVHPTLIGGKVIDAGIRHLALADHVRAEQGDGNAADGGIKRIGEHLQDFHKGIIDVRFVPLINGPQALLCFQFLHSLGLHVLGGRDMLGEELRHGTQALIPPQHHTVL